MSKKILISTFLWCLVTSVTPVFAYSDEPLQVPIKAEGDAGAKLVLTNSKESSETYSNVVNQDGYVTFNLTYTEPGEYTYVLSDSSDNADPIDISVYVTNDDEDKADNSSLSANIVAKREGKKLEDISFKKIENRKSHQTNTGVSVKELAASGAAIVISSVLLILLIATHRKSLGKAS